MFCIEKGKIIVICGFIGVVLLIIGVNVAYAGQDPDPQKVDKTRQTIGTIIYIIGIALLFLALLDYNTEKDFLCFKKKNQ